MRWAEEARLTPVARELVDKFRRLNEVVDSFINYSFQDIFRGVAILRIG